MCTFYASLPSRIESLDFPLFFYDPSMIIAGAGYDPLAVASARIVRWRLQNPFRALFERRKPRQGTAIASKGNGENLLLAWQPTQNEPSRPFRLCTLVSPSLVHSAESQRFGRTVNSSPLSLSHSPCSPNIPSVRYPLIGKAQHRHFLRAFITGTTPCDVRLLSTPVIKSPQSDGQDSVTGLLSYLMEKAVRHRRPLLGSWPLLCRFRRQKRTKKKKTFRFFPSFISSKYKEGRRLEEITRSISTEAPSSPPCASSTRPKFDSNISSTLILFILTISSLYFLRDSAVAAHCHRSSVDK